MGGSSPEETYTFEETYKSLFGGLGYRPLRDQRGFQDLVIIFSCPKMNSYCFNVFNNLSVQHNH